MLWIIHFPTDTKESMPSASRLSNTFQLSLTISFTKSHSHLHALPPPPRSMVQNLGTHLPAPRRGYTVTLQQKKGRSVSAGAQGQGLSQATPAHLKRVSSLYFLTAKGCPPHVRHSWNTPSPLYSAPTCKDKAFHPQFHT